ncbi:hypothetical protein HN415_09685 [Candidatus Woesearchaeota archaeon]|nr:hypothetical protein [Candidatus Woesearchaeota archaeon]
MPKKSKFKKKVNEIRNDLIDKIIAITLFAIAGFFMWALVQLLVYFYDFELLLWIQNLPYAYSTFHYFFDEISTRSDLGIFYLFLFSSLFFLPIPLEALYFAMLKEGLTLHKTFTLVVLGMVIGQIINYMLGRILGFIFISFIKKKTRKNIQKKLSKYGILAVTTVHLIPFPFQIFNFISGILKYNFLKWLFFMIVGLSIKHLIMYYLYFLIF